MTTLLEFNEKRFWISLFSIMARREAARESVIANILPANRNRSSKTEIRMNGQISTWSPNAQAASPIQNSELFSIKQRSKARTEIEKVSYAEELLRLTRQYLELSLPLTAALRAAEADVQDFVTLADY
jgi:hypothetical protein